MNAGRRIPKYVHDYAVLWHSGQWSALYLLSCNAWDAEISEEDMRRALHETEENKALEIRRGEAAHSRLVSAWLTAAIKRKEMARGYKEE